MKIGIIGSGNIGGALARRFTTLGHEVSVANSRGPETLADLERETGAKAVTVQEAARAGNVVIVTIPEAHIPNLPKTLFAGVPNDVVVVDTGNYYPQQRDGRIAGIEDGVTESRWVSSQLLLIRLFQLTPMSCTRLGGWPQYLVLAASELNQPDKQKPARQTRNQSVQQYLRSTSARTWAPQRKSRPYRATCGGR
jgi:NADP oxidoreductase coenzyme F420-dependent